MTACTKDHKRQGLKATANTSWSWLLSRQPKGFDKGNCCCPRFTRTHLEYDILLRLEERTFQPPWPEKHVENWSFLVFCHLDFSSHMFDAMWKKDYVESKKNKDITNRSPTYHPILLCHHFKFQVSLPGTLRKCARAKAKMKAIVAPEPEHASQWLGSNHVSCTGYSLKFHHGHSHLCRLSGKRILDFGNLEPRATLQCSPALHAVLLIDCQWQLLAAHGIMLVPPPLAPGNATTQSGFKACFDV